MQFVSALMGKLPEYRELKGALAHLGFPAAATGLSHIHKAAQSYKFICNICSNMALSSLKSTPEMLFMASS